MQPTPGWGGYDDDDELEPPGTVEAEFGIGSGLANPYPIPIPKPNPNPNQVEAECPQRALFRDESRQQGAYVFLGEDMPHLFLPVFGVRPLPRRGGREAMVRYPYPYP